MLILKQYFWFYSHPGHNSLGGNLRCLIWHLPQVFVYYLLSINYIPLLLQTPYDDRLCLFLTRVQQVGEGACLAVGEPYHLPPTAAIPHTLYNPIRAVLPHQPQGLGGETENLPQYHLPVNTSWGVSYREQEIWSVDHMGEPLSGQGLLHGGSS